MSRYLIIPLLPFFLLILIAALTISLAFGIFGVSLRSTPLSPDPVSR